MTLLHPECLTLRRLGGFCSAVINTGLPILRGFRKGVRRVAGVPNLVKRMKKNHVEGLLNIYLVGAASAGEHLKLVAVRHISAWQIKAHAVVGPGEPGKWFHQGVQ
jgi:hypothetical protein